MPPKEKSELEQLTEVLQAQTARLEEFTRADIRERLVPEAIIETADSTIQSHTANVVSQARHSIADHLTGALAQANSAFSTRATQEITQRGSQLEAALHDKLDEMTTGALSRISHRAEDITQHAVKRISTTSPPSPELVEWEVSRDNDGRISSLDNGKIRRVPVRDFSGAIVRVVEEPI